jgi:molecular chaperone DnaK
MFSRIIPRNTALPASRSEVYCTIVDGQECVHVEIFQGENDDVRHNTRVGDFVIEGLADVPAGNQIVTHMTLTLDGVLKVSSTEKRTGLQKQVRIDNALAQFQRDEHEQARRRVDELFETRQREESLVVDAQCKQPGPMRTDGEPVELSLADGLNTDASTGDSPDGAMMGSQPPDTGGVAEVEADLNHSLVEAAALMERGERLLVSASPEDRAEIERRIARLRAAVAERAMSELEVRNAELDDLLFYLET